MTFEFVKWGQPLAITRCGMHMPRRHKHWLVLCGALSSGNWSVEKKSVRVYKRLSLGIPPFPKKSHHTLLSPPILSWWKQWHAFSLEQQTSVEKHEKKYYICYQNIKSIWLESSSVINSWLALWLLCRVCRYVSAQDLDSGNLHELEVKGGFSLMFMSSESLVSDCR